jgi:2-(1,2-epoxy-1,2-dihydrophenyl)acetyl-CoA isomerase
MGEASDSVIMTPAVEGVARIVFNRPDRLNALDLEMTVRFGEAVDACLADQSVRVIVVEANGRAFMAGGDLTYFDQADDRRSAAETIVAAMHKSLKRLDKSGVVTIGSLKGALAGGGMSLALGLDLLIAADDAAFSFAYPQIGTSADCGGTWSLPRLVGTRKALEIALMGDPVDASAALEMGLVNAVVPLADLEAETTRWATRLTRSAPVALGEVKQLIRTSFDHSYAQQLDRELESFVRCAGTEDFAGAVSAFLNKKPYEFKGR